VSQPRRDSAPPRPLIFRGVLLNYRKVGAWGIARQLGVEIAHCRFSSSEGIELGT
jgi:hypothetical protein